LGKGFRLIGLLAVQEQPASLKIDLQLVAVLELVIDLGQIGQDDDRKTAVDSGASRLV